MTTGPDESRLVLRALRQRLESLRRAGVDRVPSPPAIAPVRRSTAPRVEAIETKVGPEGLAERTSPAPPPPPPRPPRSEAAPVPPPPTALPVLVPSLFDTETPIAAPPLSREERIARLADLEAEVAVCQKCPHLAAARTRTVFGVGSPTARLMFVGEAPGADEDRLGEPFVGRAGKLLDDMITKGMGLTRAEVYIANVLKSRPPENRTPGPEEIAQCFPYLERQIEIIRPEFLCLLGRTAAGAVLDTSLPLGRLRGKWHRYRGIPTVVTYHPAYLLRYPEEKKKAWEDLQMLMKAMGLTPPARRGG